MTPQDEIDALNALLADTRAQLESAMEKLDAAVKAAQGMLEIVDHLRNYPKCNARKFIFCRDGSEHGNIVDARAAINAGRS